MSKSKPPKGIVLTSKIIHRPFIAAYTLGDDVVVGDLLRMGKNGKLRKVRRLAKAGILYGCVMAPAKAGDVVELAFGTKD